MNLRLWPVLKQVHRYLSHVNKLVMFPYYCYRSLCTTFLCVSNFAQICCFLVYVYICGLTVRRLLLQRPPSSSLSYPGPGNDDVRSPGSGGTPGPLSQQPSSQQSVDNSDPGKTTVIHKTSIHGQGFVPVEELIFFVFVKY